jgi:hypothetical protein
MKHLNTEAKQELDWRRSRVLELSSQGYSERQIAEVIKVNDTAVHRDLVYLRQQAQQALQHHIHEVVPEEYQRCMTGIKQTLKQVVEIGNTVSDPKTKLEAKRIAIDCYRFTLDMSTNAGIVSDALKFVNQSEKKINDMQRQTAEETETETGEEATATSGVY